MQGCVVEIIKKGFCASTKEGFCAFAKEGFCTSFEGFYAFEKEGFAPSCSDEAELTSEAYLTRAKPKLMRPI